MSATHASQTSSAGEPVKAVRLGGSPFSAAAAAAAAVEVVPGRRAREGIAKTVWGLLLLELYTVFLVSLAIEAFVSTPSGTKARVYVWCGCCSAVLASMGVLRLVGADGQGRIASCAALLATALTVGVLLGLTKLLDPSLALGCQLAGVLAAAVSLSAAANYAGLTLWLGLHLRPKHLDGQLLALAGPSTGALGARGEGRHGAGASSALAPLAIVAWEFIAEGPTEMSIGEGDRLRILHQDPRGWTWCRSVSGCEGWVPHSALITRDVAQFALVQAQQAQKEGRQAPLPRAVLAAERLGFRASCPASLGSGRPGLRAGVPVCPPPSLDEEARLEDIHFTVDEDEPLERLALVMKLGHDPKFLARAPPQVPEQALAAAEAERLGFCRAAVCLGALSWAVASVLDLILILRLGTAYEVPLASAFAAAAFAGPLALRLHWRAARAIGWGEPDGCLEAVVDINLDGWMLLAALYSSAVATCNGLGKGGYLTGPPAAAPAPVTTAAPTTTVVTEEAKEEDWQA